MSNRTAFDFVEEIRRPLPIDCKFLILDLLGLANIRLCRFLIFMPVLKGTVRSNDNTSFRQPPFYFSWFHVFSFSFLTFFRAK